MLAVTVRAYPAALILLDTIHRVVSKVVIPPMACEMQGTSSTEQEHAIKNVMSAWRSSVAGTGSTSNNSKTVSEPCPPSIPLFKNAIELPHHWPLPSSSLPQSQSEFATKGLFLHYTCLHFCLNIVVVVCFIL